MIDPKRPLGSGERRILVGVAAVAAALMLYLSGQLTVIVCDGAYERWQIPDDYDGSGCAQMTPAWHKAFPWNHGNDELVCLGMCDGIPMWTPDD